VSSLKVDYYITETQNHQAV